MTIFNSYVSLPEGRWCWMMLTNPIIPHWQKLENLETSRTHISRIQSGHSTQVPWRLQPAKPGVYLEHSSMSTDAGGYVGPSLAGSDLIDLSVQGGNGEGCKLKLSGSCTGWEVYRMVSKQFPRKRGAHLTLHYLDSPLILHKELQAEGIVVKAATLSCTYVPTDLYAAWCTVQGLPVSHRELALQGVTRIAGATAPEYLHHLPESLEHLTFDQSLKGVTLPNSLQTLTVGFAFNQSLDRVTLPSRLQTLTFGFAFNQSLDRVTLPSSLQTLTFGFAFNQSLDRVTLPSSLQTLTFGSLFNQSLEGVTLPSSLQSLTFGCNFRQSWDRSDIAKQSSEFGIWRCSLTRAWNEWPCHAAFRVWRLAAWV